MLLPHFFTIIFAKPTMQAMCKKVLFILLLFFSSPVQAQKGCESAEDAFKSAQISFEKTEGFLQAPGGGMVALADLKQCGVSGIQLAQYLQTIAGWHTELEQFDEAKNLLGEALSMMPDDGKSSLWLQMGQMHTLSRDFAAAADNFAAAAKSHAGTEPVFTLTLLAAQTALWLETGDFNKAAVLIDSAATYTTTLNEHPELQVKFDFYRTALAGKRGDFKRPIEDSPAILDKLNTLDFDNKEDLQVQALILLIRCAAIQSEITVAENALNQLNTLKNNLSPVKKARWEPAISEINIYVNLQSQHLAPALEYFKKTLALIYRNRISHRIVEALAYQDAAKTVFRMGDNNTAIDYYNQSNSIEASIPNSNERAISVNYVGLGQSYNSIGEPELAGKYLRKSLELIRKYDPAPIPIIARLLNLISLDISINDTTSAYAGLLEVDSLLQQPGSESATLGLKSQAIRAWLMFYKMSGQSAAGIAKGEAFLAANGPKLSGYYRFELEVHMSHLYIRAGDFQKGFESCEKLVRYFEKQQAERGRVSSVEHYSWMLGNAAESAWKVFEHTGDTSYISIAEKRCETSENLLYELRKKQTDDPNRNWITDGIIYVRLIEVRQRLYERTGLRYHLERAFLTSETFRMVQFQSNLNTETALQFGEIAPDSLRIEQEIAKSIAAAETEQNDLLFRPAGPEKDSLKMACDSRLFELRRQYTALLESFERQYPDYFRLRYYLPEVNLDVVQQKILTPQQTLLIPYTDGNKLIVMAIRTDSVRTLIAEFNHRHIDTLRNAFRDYPKTAAAPEADYLAQTAAMTRAAYGLYEKMLAPMAGFFTREILISPNEKLAYIPFEALLTKPATNLARPSSWSFWANEKDISYIQTATIFQFIREKKYNRRGNGTFYAFAPYFDGDTTLYDGLTASRTRGDFYSPLPYTGEEVTAVARIMNGKVFLGKDAAAKDFSDNAQDCDILHIATHASAGESLKRPSFLAFQPTQPGERNLLYTQDIYALRLHADLVVLSACETGLGQVGYEEGIMGLTRAFTCAGARNVVASLWTVNDAQTKDLMVLFYKEIKKGTPYNTAMARAKRQFIGSKRQYAHPYFWAGFVLNGR